MKLSPLEVIMMIAALSAPSALVRAVEEDSSLFALPLEALLEIKVSGVSLRKQSQLEMPASANVFSEDSIKRLGVNTLEDLIRFVPGFQQIRGDDSNATTIASRGRLTGLSGREVLLIVDGVRISQWFDGGTYNSLGFFPLNGVKTIEFIRGPSSHIYGANAFMGVINVITGSRQNKASWVTGSQQRNHLSLTQNFVLGGLNHNITVDLTDEEGQQYEVPDPFTLQATNIRDPKRARAIVYTASFNEWSAQLSHRNTESGDFYSIGGISEDFSDYQYEFNAASIRHQKIWNNRWTTNTSADYQWYKRHQETILSPPGSFTNNSTPTSDEPLLGILNIQGDKLDFRVNTIFNASHHWKHQFGIEYRRPSLEGAYFNNNFNIAQLTAGEFPLTYYGDFETATTLIEPAEDTVRGIFGLSSYSREGIFEFTAGMRHDHSDLAGDNISPRLSYVHFVNSVNTVKLIYSEAFRSPAANETLIKNNPVQQGNPDLEAETVTTTELIWMYGNKNRRLQASLFDNRFDGSITQEGSDGRRIFSNLGKSRSQGYEVTWVHPVTHHLTFRLAFSQLLDKTEDAIRLADQQLNALLNYNYQQWNIALDYDYVGERQYLKEDGAANPPPPPVVTTIDSIQLVNAHVSYHWSSKWRVFATAKNLLDEEYAFPSTGASVSAIPARGLEFLVGIEFKH